MTLDTPQERFQTLLERHRKIVFKVAGMYCRHPDDRRDLEQEICAQLWRSFPTWDSTRAFSTWVYRIALNVAISFARSAGRRSQYIAPMDDETGEPSHDESAAREDDERVRALGRCIDRLGELDRALLLLYLEDRSYREIAEVLGLSEAGAMTRVSRLKQRLRVDLAAAD